MGGSGLKQAASVILKEMGGETILYDSRNQAVHVLNPTARLIWELCDGDHTEQAIEQVLKSHFAVPEGHDVGQDVQRTLALFSAQGLLQDPA
jgi:PqqD family protein of HPr-rel-A system